MYVGFQIEINDWRNSIFLLKDVASHSEYDVKNKESLPEKYICPCCHKILKDPVQLTCGDRICKNDIGDKKK